ncbi:hypothetical protein QQY66_19060 [Streptomyces sp. DG2A-72]|uniref:hypothetical protein n=1 Tax=Streptomyces sp. DG2A-72 TaxID=3051386 RepID=UPI00265BA52B|nr:hypothetical protein [Streptomyces sp. DG2A-72]MDO0933681.1 hypothetical protein [Streptomyces sp. DG2A-72]
MFSGPRAIAAVVAAFLLVTATGCDSEGSDDAKPRWTRWHLDYVSPSPDGAVVDLAATAEDEGWALANRIPDDGPTEYHLLHRRGATWKRAELPLRRAKGAEFSNMHLDASDPGNVWLFASQLTLSTDDFETTSTAVRWDGRRWRKASVDFSVSDVAVLAPDDVWALNAGSETTQADLLHWDGKRWTGQDLPVDQAGALAANGPDDVWAVGFRDDQPATMHFDGKKWRLVPTPEFHRPEPDPEDGASLSDIVTVSRDDVWAFGAHRYWTGEEEHETTIALHWDGKRWSKAPRSLDTARRKNPDLGSFGTRDGAGGFVLGDGLHRTADGALHMIKAPKPVAGRSGKITKADRRQDFDVSELDLVPGTHEIWAAGNVSVDLSDDANFMRGVIASYFAGG